MEYDFETILDRSKSSSKWAQMREKKPGVPANITPLSVADMEFKSPPEVTEALREYLKDADLGYPCAGEGVYRAILSWVKRRYGWEASSGQIIFTPGVVNGFFQAVRAFTEPGDGVIVMPPVYYPFYSAAKRNGRKLRKCPLKEKGGRWEIDFEHLEALAGEERTRLLLLCSPHNPVGRVWRREEIERIGEICLNHHVFVVSDEIHCDLIMPGYAFTSFGCMEDRIRNNSMVCISPSKTFNLAGMSASCVFIFEDGRREQFLRELSKTAQMNRLSRLGFQAVEAAYTSCDRWLAELIQVIEGNYCFLRNFLRENCPEIRVGELEGTYLAWLDLRAYGLSRQRQEQIMLEADLFFDEGYLFGDEGDGFERINLACPRSVLRGALERLLEAVRMEGKDSCRA